MNNPYLFATLVEAVAGLQEELDEMNSEVRAGGREEDEICGIDSFQIRRTATGALFQLDLIDGKVMVLEPAL